MAERYEVWQDNRGYWWVPKDEDEVCMARCGYEDYARLIAHRLNTHDGLVELLASLHDEMVEWSAMSCRGDFDEQIAKLAAALAAAER